MYDFIVIGAGPGGYTAAIRAGAKGKKVLLIEKSKLGGVCLNEGCIPTKILLRAAEYYCVGERTARLGISVEKTKIDLFNTQRWIETVIKTLQQQMRAQLKKYKVDFMRGAAELIGTRTVKVKEKSYRAKNIILATGSSPVIPSLSGIKSQSVKTSSDIFEITRIPKHMVIVGGGAVGMEFASFFSNLGVELHIVEIMPEIIPSVDKEIASYLRKSMRSIQFHLETYLESIEDDEVIISEKGQLNSLSADLVLVSVGRKPNTEGLGLGKIGIRLNSEGIVVDKKMQTNIDGVYAVGDVTGKSMFAHTAMRMAEVAVNTISGEITRMRYNAIPWVIYTDPEVAVCGLTEEEALRNGKRAESVSLPMRSISRFFSEYGDALGLCKVVFDLNSGVILGIHMVGPGCSEMIFGAAAIIEAELRVKDVREIIFPHPTVSEIIKEILYKLP
jgi:dihydrolipoamide dehydrogenase